jgi:hypothetical protein
MIKSKAMPEKTATQKTGNSLIPRLPKSLVLKVDERCIRKFGRVITSAAPSAQNAVLNSQPGLVYAEEKSVKLAFIFRDDAQTVKVTYAM